MSRSGSGFNGIYVWLVGIILSVVFSAGYLRRELQAKPSIETVREITDKRCRDFCYSSKQGAVLQTNLNNIQETLAEIKVEMKETNKFIREIYKGDNNG